MVAVGREDDDDAAALGDGANHRAGGLGGLVVGVGVEEDDGVHRDSVHTIASA